MEMFHGLSDSTILRYFKPKTFESEIGTFLAFRFLPS